MPKGAVRLGRCRLSEPRLLWMPPWLLPLAVTVLRADDDEDDDDDDDNDNDDDNDDNNDDDDDDDGFYILGKNRWVNEPGG